MKVIGIILTLAFLTLGVANYITDENFKELSSAIVTIVGLVQTYDVFLSKKDKNVEEKLSMILNILENDKEE